MKDRRQSDGWSETRGREPGAAGGGDGGTEPHAKP